MCDPRMRKMTFSRQFIPFLSCLAVFTLLSGCGGSGGQQNPPSRLIGVAGGSLTSADGKVTLVVPPNAVNVDTQFTINRANFWTASNRILGTVYDIEPTGTVFAAAAPPQLTITYNALPAGVDPATLTIGTLANGQWVDVPGSAGNQAAQTVTVSLAHLSPYAVLQPAANQDPVADAGESYDGQVGLPVNFTAADSSDPDGDPLTFTWNFGDGSQSVPTDQFNTSHTYASQGTYTVTLTVSDGRGGSDTAQVTATITTLPPPNTPPTARLVGAPYAGTVGQPISFSAADSFDPDGDNLTFVWNFGDGQIRTGMTPMYAYTSDGTWPVRVIVSDGRGGSDDEVTTAVVSPAPTTNNPPVITGTTLPPASLTNQVLQFDAVATDEDGHALTYRWNFGDQTVTPFDPSASAAHAYNTAGTFTVTLTVDDGHGGQDSETGTVSITSAAAPVAFSQAYTLYLRQGTGDFPYQFSYAMTLAGSGTPPLRFNIVSFPTLRDPLAPMDLLRNNYYQWWDSVAGGWRLECRAYPVTDQSCRAPTASHVELVDPQHLNEVIVSPDGAPATVVYVPLTCSLLPQNRTDTFTFTVTDGSTPPRTSAPATISISFHEAVCKGTTH